MGSRPVQILADDLEVYVVKYPFYHNDFRLINEFLGAKFAVLWGIEVPDMVLIDVAREHITENFLGNQLSYSSFETPSLGFKMVENVLDLNDLAKTMDQSAINKWIRRHFLKLLFLIFG